MAESADLTMYPNHFIARHLDACVLPCHSMRQKAWSGASAVLMHLLQITEGSNALRFAAIMYRSHVSEPLTRRSSGEEPVLGDPPSREDSLIGHMPSVNPAADKEQELEFDSAIAAVSGGELGSCRADAGQRSMLERVSEGGYAGKDEASGDGAESAPSNQARQGSEPTSSSQTGQSSDRRRSSDHGVPLESPGQSLGSRPGQSLGDRPGQSLGSNGQQRNVSGGSSMSREDIREHAANIMDRMKSSAQPLPSTKVIMHGLSLMVPREVMLDLLFAMRTC